MVDSFRLKMLYNRKSVRDLLLSDKQIDIVMAVMKAGSMSSAELAALLDCSIENASVSLKRVYLKGYLKRYASTDGTGGIIYIYTYPL